MNKTLKNINYLSLISPLVLIILCVLSIGQLQKPLLTRQIDLTPQDIQQQETLTRTQLHLIQTLPTIGYDNIIAGWNFLNFVQYFGDGNARDITGYSLVPEYYRIIVNKDPRFVTSYLFLDTATSLFAGRPDISVELMEQGLQHLSPEIPSAYLVWTYKGINELLFLGRTQDAKQSYQTASEWAKIENTETSIAIRQRALETAQFLENNPDSRSARASAWMMILGNAREEEVRQLALQQLDELGAQITIDGNNLSVTIPQDDP
ncbi:hypothetical protein Cyast_2718 [Cyanobacterium stanieri PCC 7202]|uniref:Uncharacterized protein n=1 Tax=Cyanobacterium stanieri (strain ATCC 29140 / PCC 7202) TaxID=292563 RepID=K9YNZ5_CYASC|nr:hypothetical protein Cyast_2718 [Cyanobacterium stanieri PCC 7202]